MKSASIVDLSRIPGVGPSIASDLYSLGIREVADLRGGDPQFLYSELCRKMNQRVDRCVLYVFRCAVYFASERVHDPDLLKWWNWKDDVSVRGAAENRHRRPRSSSGLAGKALRSAPHTGRARRDRAGRVRPS